MTKHRHLTARSFKLYAYATLVLVTTVLVVTQSQEHLLSPFQEYHQEAISSGNPVLRQSPAPSKNIEQPASTKETCPPQETFDFQPMRSNNNNDDDGTTIKPCALLFFGLPKQFKSLVLPSIRDNILAHNSECDIYAHAYNVSSVSSSRNKEHDTTIDAAEILELTTNAVLETNEEFLQKRDLEYYRQGRFFPQKMGWEYPTSMDNMIKQWHSIEQVWNLMQEAERDLNIQYSRVGLFRSDVFYANPIHVMDDNDAVTPLFASRRANDRMFYGSYENARIWATIRFPSVECYEPRRSKYGLHSEQFMKDHILAHMTDVATKKDICFFRVRATGLVLSDDCRCDNHKDCDSVKDENVSELVSSIVGKECVPGKVKWFTPQTQCPV